MQNILPLFIEWDPNPALFTIGSFPLKYYGLFWAIGIAMGYYVVQYQYRDKKIAPAIFEPLFFYCFVGIFVGARLGHCLFYDFEYYKDNILEIFLPIRFLADGGWKFTGYAGLASHGGTLGLIIALWLYCRKTKMNYMDVLDMIAVATPITATWIRLANLMNSEIIGNQTDVPWAFIFTNVDALPRHPAQLYEALAYLLLFFIMLYFYKKHDASLHRGFYFGFCLVYIFTFRFFIEFLKVDQVAFEETMLLNMGQWLSIPFVIIGALSILYGKQFDKMKPERKVK